MKGGTALLVLGIQVCAGRHERRHGIGILPRRRYQERRVAVGIADIHLRVMFGQRLDHLLARPGFSLFSAFWIGYRVPFPRFGSAPVASNRSTISGSTRAVAISNGV